MLEYVVSVIVGSEVEIICGAEMWLDYYNYRKT